MEDLTEAGHLARWNGSHYIVSAPTGIQLGSLELVGDVWEWAEFTSEYDRGVEVADRSFDSPEEALHAMLEWGGWLV
ncbi:hypothetical protein RN607_07185 [Demequina capsici]|uniref:Uncharacterized protein n=1 Tax=Demequina capsici TaxID=3075620 RepID=A0AA96JHA1_9MICO|nr:MULTISPECIES: hypothetical protein [unclassified Demequina]WNM25888.1 hypothetical protein RN606_06975 [Demequina sp. OYTSA14]WNM28784.1 hypothetical protein RN607_07185 [Demequina sp. PMTSA13]